MRKANTKTYPANKISSYFYKELPLLLLITVTGIIYNAGLGVGPWLEGQMVQALCDILGGNTEAAWLVTLAVIYALAIAVVQVMRFLKRLFVRKFANRTGLRMKETIYRNILNISPEDRESSDTGTVMTKAISDAEACAEGMRKVTTEIFDTGVVLIVYIAMLFAYDVRMSLIVILFPPAAYICADLLKGVVTGRIAAAKESAGRLNSSSLELVSNSLLYRAFGLEASRREKYEEDLKDYETKQILGNVWESSMPPVYRVISMIGVIPILWLGSRNVMGTGWTAWNIAALTTYISCYAKLSEKAAKSAKLFNSIQKAEVSWRRVKGYLRDIPDFISTEPGAAETVTVKDVSFAYPGKPPVFSGLNFDLKPGEILAVTGPVGCGKSTFGRLFLDEKEFEGSINIGGEDIKWLWDEGKSPVGYMGHRPELISGTIRENICLGNDGDITDVLKCVCFYDEVMAMPEKENTLVGESGIRLSGGQQARLALARTLYHRRGLYVLDDPFSALDRKTEDEIFFKIKSYAKDSSIILISHRLSLFPQADGVLWLDGGKTVYGSHEDVLNASEEYLRLFSIGEGGRL